MQCTGPKYEEKYSESVRMYSVQTIISRRIVDRIPDKFRKIGPWEGLIPEFLVSNQHLK